MAEKTRKRPKFRDLIQPKKTRAGIELSAEEIALIRQKRKELRADLKKQGITSKKDFEITASSLGYYFDKHKRGALLLWLFSGRVLPVLLALMLTALFTVFSVSRVTQLRGYFTVNLTNELFEEGFSLRQYFNSEAQSAALNLGEVQQKSIPNIAMNSLPKELETLEGNHSGEDYFAYSFYITNGGKNDAAYEYELFFSDLKNGLDEAVWIMLIKSDMDGEGNILGSQMTVYAKADKDGNAERLPKMKEVEEDGELKLKQVYFKWREFKYYEDMAEFPEQFIYGDAEGSKFLFDPIPFEGEKTIAKGIQTNIAPGATQKFTTVIWLEGNDPDCTNKLIGSSAGISIKFRMISEDAV